MSILLIPPDICPEDFGERAETVVWPVQIAPDSELLPRWAERVLTATSVLGDQKALQAEAYRRAAELGERLPLFRGVNLLWAMEDSLADRLQAVVAQELLFEKLQGIVSRGDTVISAPDGSGDLPVLLELLLREGCSVGKVAAAGRSSTRGANWLRRIKRLRNEAAGGWQGLGVALLERLDRRFLVRPRLGKTVFPATPRPFKEAPTLAFASTEVFSKTILAHLDDLGDVCFVVAGKAAAMPLVKRNVPFRYWWEFVPSSGLAEKAIGEHMESLGRELQGRTSWRQLQTMGTAEAVGTMHLPFVARMVVMIGEMFDRLAPERVVVANQGNAHEAVVLHEARERGMPSILLQHGVFGDDYIEQQPLRADEIWVRGPFWKDFLPPMTRDKALVKSRPGINRTAAGRDRERDTILFLTAPYDDYPFKCVEETREILLRTRDLARELKRHFVVRVHPREEINRYREWLADTGTEHPSIHQGGLLEPELERARMAVTYCSTIFMECLRHKVPIISFDWHPFRFKSQIEKEGVFQFAQSFAHLGEIMRLVDSSPERYAEDSDRQVSLFAAGVQ